MDEVELATRRRRVAVITVAAIVVVAAAIYLFVPRTIATVATDREDWVVRVAPVAFGPQITVRGEDAGAAAGGSGLAVDARLDDTIVWHVGDEDAAATLVVGPTPRGATSVRVTSAEHGVGEAAVRQVGWRRFHVERLPGHVTVRELVAIGDAGQVLEAVSDPPAPLPVR